MGGDSRFRTKLQNYVHTNIDKQMVTDCELVGGIDKCIDRLICAIDKGLKV